MIPPGGLTASVDTQPAIRANAPKVTSRVMTASVSVPIWDVPHYDPAGASPGVHRRVEVNSTARWPERLEQVATLLRAEGAAILALQNGEVRTLFSCRIDDALAWRLVLGDDAVDRAVTDRSAFATAIPAERWGDAASYALLAPIT